MLATTTGAAAWVVAATGTTAACVVVVCGWTCTAVVVCWTGAAVVVTAWDVVVVAAAVWGPLAAAFVQDATRDCQPASRMVFFILCCHGSTRPASKTKGEGDSLSCVVHSATVRPWVFPLALFATFAHALNWSLQLRVAASTKVVKVLPLHANGRVASPVAVTGSAVAPPRAPANNCLRLC